MNALLSRSILSLALAAVSQQAFSATFFSCANGAKPKWPSNSFQYSVTSVFDAASVWRAPLDAAIGKFNENPTPFRMSRVWGDTNVATNNNQNEIWWDANITAPADAPTRIDCNTATILESDIRLSNKAEHKWTQTAATKNLLSSYKSGGNRPIEATMIHEMGHSSGLMHTADEYSVMGADYNFLNANGNVARPYVGADASGGLITLYGTIAGNREDVSVSHWRFDAPDAAGEYSKHRRTAIYDTNGVKLSFTNVNLEPVFNVSKGQQVNIEFTYENNGKNSQTFDVDYVISTDNVINSSDTKIGGRIDMFLPRSTVFTRKLPVTIPSNLTSGTTYYIGARVDSLSEVAEFTENNNQSYIAIKVL